MNRIEASPLGLTVNNIDFSHEIAGFDIHVPERGVAEVTLHFVTDDLRFWGDTTTPLDGIERLRQRVREGKL